MCYDRLHLSYPDVRFLRSLRIAAWPCPKCGMDPHDMPGR